MSTKANAKNKYTEFHKRVLKLVRQEAIEAEERIREKNKNDLREPSKVIRDDWLWAERRIGTYPKDTANSGKWLIFLTEAQIDEVWKEIKQSVEKGLLGNIAKVSTAKGHKKGKSNSHVICVYTYNWKIKKDVHNIRIKLRDLGITWKIPYKADIDTEKDKYSTQGDERISKYYK